MFGPSRNDPYIRCDVGAYRLRYWNAEHQAWRGDANSLHHMNGLDCEVYHVPQPAPADFTTPVQTGEVLYFSVDSQPAPKPILESILGTASAAKAVEQGVRDAVEGRTVEVPDSQPKCGRCGLPAGSMGKPPAFYCRDLTCDGNDHNKFFPDKPDPLDQLAAEAQAEGEDGTAWERWQSLRGVARDNGHKIRLFNAFVAAECERAVELAKASPRLSEQLDRLAQTEQFKNCQFDGADPATLSTPRRTAKEVAEDMVRMVELSASSETAIDAIQAAIERDREGR